jgi:hypothetical protein
MYWFDFPDSRASTWQKVLDVYWDRPILVDQPHNLYPTCNFSIECPTINPNHGGVLNSRTLVSTIIAGFFLILSAIGPWVVASGSIFACVIHQISLDAEPLVG